jgi:hypothetical protein
MRCSGKQATRASPSRAITTAPACSSFIGATPTRREPRELSLPLFEHDFSRIPVRAPVAPQAAPSARDTPGAGPHTIQATVPSRSLAADAPPTVLTAARAGRALTGNQARFATASAGLLGRLRAALGIAAEPAAVDADFVAAVARWQVAHHLTEDGILGGSTAATLLQPLRDAGHAVEGVELAGIARRAQLASGPTYTPNGVVPFVPGVPFNLATFNLSARFENNPTEGVFASCGEVRQLIRWDATAAASMVAKRGVAAPHTGFAPPPAIDTPVEDRGDGNWFRFGHRTGPHGTVQPFSRFRTAAGVTNMANGAVYDAQDQPGFWPDRRGQYRFQLRAVDVCNGERRIGGTDDITIDW